ncbi:MAG: MBL fold metallo-hydrolase [Bradymonadaceae bacterium]|nr:MBL fold metallo-hydrolase [Lujinxingiaceae bacterium]
MALLVVGTLALIVLIPSTSWLAAFGGTPSGERLERMRGSDQWDSAEAFFVNTDPTTVMIPNTTWSTTRDWLTKPSDAFPERAIATVRPSLATAPASGLRLSWFGHSTVLIEIDAMNILVDPVFAERASPSTLVGPRRFHAFPIDPAELPTLDAIVISHDHYDHLDMQAVRELLALSTAPFLVPLGVGAHLERWGVPASRIQEMDWWDETKIGALTIAATPSRHFSGRGLLDRFATLWASWTFVGPQHRVFFSGDTGLFDGFADISKTYGPFDIAMFEIGAYHPNWGQIHLGPEDALTAFEMMDAKLVVPIHWGTFDLGVHAWREPIQVFTKLADERGHRWAAPAPGGSIEPGLNEPRERWWD